MHPVIEWCLNHWSFCLFVIGIFVQFTPAIKCSPITSVCKWVANAVTRAAQDVESYDRSTEMESIGYSILGMSREKWNRLNKVSA